jgi:triosephosphate isomerase (TIM)
MDCLLLAEQRRNRASALKKEVFMRKLIIGNWKMHGMQANLGDILAIADAAKAYENVDTGLCLPATLIGAASAAVSAFAIGGQDCHSAASGAHTGCISADMLVDVGANMVIVGHSERRAGQGESNADVCAKAIAAHSAGLNVIVCVGETEAERDAGKARDVVLGQLAGSLPDSSDGSWLSVAYEPVWAIGTGRIPSDVDVAEMHSDIRHSLIQRFGATGEKIRILYGGSMNGENAASLLAIANVDGGLIGGASLSAAKFSPILAAANIA